MSRLTRFFEYPELELSNNLAENSMRPVVLGRKNWIHSFLVRRMFALP
jgi:transposase